MRKDNFNLRLNYQIRSPKVRVIGKNGKQIGVLNIQDALTEAKKAGLDLVEIAPTASPPVVRIVDLGKFKYELGKKQRRQKKSKSAQLKEVRLSPFIAVHDYNMRLQKIKEFLADKNKVKVTVVFMGRQMDSRNFGYKLLDRVLNDLGDKIVVDSQPKFFGRHLAMIVSPTTKSKRAEKL